MIYSNYHSNTPKENNKNLYFSEISNNFQKIVSLKKRSNSKNPILFPPKSNNIIKENKENTYSGNKLRYHSYSNKINENSQQIPQNQNHDYYHQRNNSIYY